MGLRTILCALMLLSGAAQAQTVIPQITPGSQASSAFVNSAIAAAARKGMEDGIAGALAALASGGMANQPAGTVNTLFASGGLTNGVMISGSGNRISYCPVLSCVTSPSPDHQRTSALFWATTQDDGHSEEQTVAIQTIIGTGAVKIWAPNTAYSVGDNINFQDARNSVYRVVTAGTSASSGTGPTGKGSAITDGTVVWTWINDAAINAKVGLYNEVQVVAGAGKTWAQSNNVQLEPGVVPTFNINTEMDFTNNAADCVAGVANCNALEISVNGSFKSTTGIHLSSPNAGNYAALYGLRFNGDYLASDATVEITTTSSVGIGFGTIGFGTSRHSVASIQDKSTSPISLSIQGTHSASSISDTAITPASLNLSGTYSLAAIRITSATTPNALVVGNGQKVCFNDTDACLSHASGKLIYQVGGVTLFSVADTTGNAIFKGSVTPSGTP